MTPVRQLILGGALLLSLVTAFVITQQRIKLLSLRAEQAEQAAAQQAAALQQVTQNLNSERAYQKTLKATQQRLQKGLAEREQLIEDLSHDQPDFAAWGAVSLPDTTRSLLDRPPLSGAADYQQWVSRSHPMPAAGDESKHQR
jgi:LysB family phage lysis regulatory protein